MVIRVSDKTQNYSKVTKLLVKPNIFLDVCVEVMRLGFGMPALNNDEIIIPSFMD